ncbi:MAG: MBL fold metallo-hydrolase [Deferrisomatales bacterium]|nr:MBL fold metallo-hydrolase [Deferrisomatales bacterium]
MIFRQTGQVVPGFHVLGNPHTPCYLLDAPRPALFDSGFSFLSRFYADHALRVLAGRQPEILFLTHVHFDHCGGASFLRDAFPGLRIAASAAAGEILARPRALALMRDLNEDARRMGPDIGVPSPAVTPFQPFEVDMLLGDGDEIDLGGGCRVRVLATPGHTRDFLSYYIPERKILIASEAVGCADTSGRIMVEFVADYDAYLASLRRLSELDIEVLCQGHLYVYQGPDVREYLGRSLLETERYCRWVGELLDEEGGCVEGVVGRVKAAEYDPWPEPKQPESAYLLNTTARVRGLARRSKG